MTPLYVNINDAVQLSGTSRSTLYVEMKEGRLPAIKSGRRTLIAVSDIEKWLSELPAWTPNS
jgi:hypothetical protein